MGSIASNVSGMARREGNTSVCTQRVSVNQKKKNAVKTLKKSLGGKELVTRSCASKIAVISSHFFHTDHNLPPSPPLLQDRNSGIPDLPSVKEKGPNV